MWARGNQHPLGRMYDLSHPRSLPSSSSCCTFLLTVEVVTGSRFEDLKSSRHLWICYATSSPRTFPCSTTLTCWCATCTMGQHHPSVTSKSSTVHSLHCDVTWSLERDERSGRTGDLWMGRRRPRNMRPCLRVIIINEFPPTVAEKETSRWFR